MRTLRAQRPVPVFCYTHFQVRGAALLALAEGPAPRLLCLYSDQFYLLLVGTGLSVAGGREHPEPEGWLADWGFDAAEIIRRRCLKTGRTRGARGGSNLL